VTVADHAGTWQLDQAASTVAIRNKHTWGLGTVKGIFVGLSGQGEVQPDGAVHGTVTLDAASLDTRNPRRDKHLRSADFFDVDNHPEITFTVQGADLQADNTVRVTGQLTARGISRPRTFDARLITAAADVVELAADFVVDRGEFGMNWNMMGIIRGLTTVTATLRFTRSAG
jgi:polyisoprenoid-binding protein YceI